MGSPQTRSAGQLKESPQQNKVGQKTGRVRKSTSATRRSLNEKLTGKRIATKPAQKLTLPATTLTAMMKWRRWRRWTIIVTNEDRRQKPHQTSNHALEEATRNKIVLSKEGAVKRKKMPAKARKPVRAPELQKSSS